MLLYLGAPGGWALAAAPPRQVRLQHTRAGSAGTCPDAERFQLDLSAQLGLSPFGEEAPELLAVTLADGPPGRLRATLSLSDGTGRPLGARTLEATDCGSLHTAAVFAAALVLDPLGKGFAPPPPPPPEPLPPPRAHPPGTPPAPALPSPAPQEPASAWRVRVGALAVGGAWVLSDPGVGASAIGELGQERWSVGLELGALISTADTSAWGSHRTTLLRGGVWPCVELGRWGACLGGQLGLLRLSGPGRATTASETRWGALGARARLDLPVTAAHLVRVSLGPTCAVLRSHIFFGEQPLWEMPTCGAELGLGMVWQP